MKQKIILFLQEPVVKKIVKIFATIMIVHLVIIVWKWKQLPPQLPLFYSLPRSTDQLAVFWQILLLPFFALFFFALNFLFASLLYSTEKLASILLVIIGVVTSLLLLITLIKIVFLVT